MASTDLDSSSARPAPRGRAAIGIALLLAMLGLGIILTAARNCPLKDSDAFDYLEIALNWADGRGLSATATWVPHLRLLRDLGWPLQDLDTTPMLQRYPLPVMFEGVLIRAGVNPYVAAQAFSATGYALSGIVLFLLLSRVFGSFGAASPLALAWLMNGTAVESGLSGLTEPMAVALYLVTLIVIVGRPRSLPQAALLGAVGALALYNRRPSAFYMAPVIFLCLFPLPARGQGTSWRISLTRLAVASLTFLAIQGPLMVRNYRLTGNPVFSMADTESLTFGMGKDFFVSTDVMSMPVTPRETWRAYRKDIIRKYWRNVWAGLSGAREFLIINKLLLVPFLLGAAFCLMGWPRVQPGWEPSHLREVLILIFVSWAVNLLGVSICTQAHRFYAFFWPFVPVVACVGLYILLSPLMRRFSMFQGPDPSRAALLVSAWLAAALFIGFNRPRFRAALTPMAIRQETLQDLREARPHVCSGRGPGALITDVSNPAAVELHGCRLLCVQIPADHRAFDDLSRWVRVRAVFLSSQGRGVADPPRARAYMAARFPRQLAMRNGARLFLPDD